MPLLNENPTINMFKKAFADLGYRCESFELAGKTHTRFTAPGGGSWLTRDARISYPLLDARSIAISTDKPMSYELSQKSEVHSPRTITFTDIVSHRNELGALLALGPVVVKPSNSSLSWGVTLNIRSKEALEAAVIEAKNFSDKVIAQEQVSGEEVRFLVIDGQSKAALLRRTPRVVGDGKHTITELVARENKQRRDMTHLLAKYPELDDRIINFEQFDMSSVPAKGELVELSKSTMIRGGASMYNIIDEIDDSYKRVAEKSARALSAQFIVVDIMIQDLTQPSNGKNYAFIEYNSAPVLALFYSCRGGAQYDVVAELVPRIDSVLKERSI